MPYAVTEGAQDECATCVTLLASDVAFLAPKGQVSLLHEAADVEDALCAGLFLGILSGSIKACNAARTDCSTLSALLSTAVYLVLVRALEIRFGCSTGRGAWIVVISNLTASTLLHVPSLPTRNVPPEWERLFPGVEAGVADRVALLPPEARRWKLPNC